MTLEEKIETLFKIITELHARETTCNCVIKDLFDKSWDDLCDMGLKLLSEIKDCEGE